MDYATIIFPLVYCPDPIFSFVSQAGGRPSSCSRQGKLGSIKSCIGAQTLFALALCEPCSKRSDFTLLNFHCLQVTIFYQISEEMYCFKVPLRVLVESCWVPGLASCRNWQGNICPNGTLFEVDARMCVVCVCVRAFWVCVLCVRNERV
jgi:hypothetical protein